MTKSSIPDQIDPLEILREEARAAALCHGVDRCDELASELVSRFATRIGGMHVYVPKRSTVMRLQVADQIREKFNGSNVRQLSSEFSLSVRHVRRILMG